MHPAAECFGDFITFHHYALLIFMYFLRLQTCIVWFLSLFGEGPMCMCKNFKLLCCAAYILNFIVSIFCLLAEFVVFGRIFSRIP